MCYASGNAGGIFGPSLFIGATIGGAVGSVAHTLFPAYTAEPGAYALVGMGTAFAGIVRTPLTSVIMIFEVTRDYTIIVPLMISNLIAYFISYKLQPEPIYEALAHQDGVHLPTAESRLQYGAAQVAQAMRTGEEWLSPRAEVAEAAATLGTHDAWPVSDERGLWGMVRKTELESAVAKGEANRTLAELVSRSADFPYVHSDQHLGVALQRMGAAGLSVLPVVSRADLRQLLGVVTLDGILDAYRVGRGA
jgi:CIC family chloride channel protein